MPSVIPSLSRDSRKHRAWWRSLDGLGMTVGSRRFFLASVAIAGAALAASKADAAVPATFDPALTQAELDAIARGIAANAKSAAVLKRLKNSDAPAVRFRIPGAEA